MPTGYSKCPVCNGKGTLTEDSLEYEFITRDPITSRCPVCAGKGVLNPRKLLPNGQEAHTIMPKKQKAAKRLNVSRKAVVADVDTGVGYEPEERKEPYEPPRFVEMALNPRLQKVLASGKEFLIVTETEPYYLDVYRMIRMQERLQVTWSAEDEERYVEALEAALDKMTREACNG